MTRYRGWAGLSHAYRVDPRGVATVLAVADTLPAHPERTAVSPSLRYELASIIEHESGWNPTRVNPGGCAGLIQICPGTAKSLGVVPGDIPRMSREEQAELILRYYHRLPPPRIPGDLYLSTFLPVFAGAPSGTVIACEDSEGYIPGTRLTRKAVWRDNPSLRDEKGCITTDSVRSVVIRDPPPFDIDAVPIPVPSPPKGGSVAKGDTPSALGPMALLILVILLLGKRMGR